MAEKKVNRYIPDNYEERRKGHSDSKTEKKSTKTNTEKTKKTTAANSKKAMDTKRKNKSGNISKKEQKKPYKGSPLKIIPLGGLDEIGKNFTLYEFENDMFIVDCGMSFPDAEMPGVDIVIPDFSYVIKNSDKLRGIVLTHGHEDHIGALPYFLKQLNTPVYGTPLTIGIVKGKLKEHGLDASKLFEVKPGGKVNLGCFLIEFIHVNHSIPDSVSFAITTPVGTIIQTGDFKIDTTPIDGEVIDLARFSELGSKGVLALLMDSTNATRPGFTMSEKTVGQSFSRIFNTANGKRIIVATFSSNIHRVQQIVDEAVRCKRKIVIQGRSMLNVVNIARDLGYLNIPDGILIDIEMIKNYTDEQLVIITTGSQGEAMSALHRIAFGDHRKISAGPNDLIIISSNPIPGNEKMVNTVVNELMKQGAEVVYERMYEVHVSGHACQEELKIMLGMTKPKFFMPVHGEQMHLIKNSQLGQVMGISKKNIVVTSIGKVVELTPNSIKVSGEVQSGQVFVDGLGVGDVGNIVLRDRKRLSEDGLIVVAITIDRVYGTIISGPDLLSRGFVYVKENEQLMEEARVIVMDALDGLTKSIDKKDWNAVRNGIRDSLSSYVFQRTRRNPMILPIVMEA